MRRASLAGLAAMCLFAGTASAQPSADFTLCGDEAIDADRRIAACAAVLAVQGMSASERAFAHYNRAVSFDAKGDVDAALAEYDRAIGLNTDYAPAFANRGALRLTKGEDGLAFADFQEAIRLDPRLALAYVNRANYYSKRDRLAEALADYDRALRIDPSLTMAYTLRGNIRAGQGDLDGALRDHNEALRRDPKLARAYVNRAAVYSDQRQYDKALADFDAALQIEPDYARAIARRGITRLKMGDKAAAAADFGRAIEIDPEDSLALGNLGFLYSQIGRIDQALSYIDRAIASDPRFVGAIVNRGLIYAEKGDVKRARADFDEALRQDPNDIDALYNRALLKLETNDAAGALVDCSQALKLDPEYAAAYSVCGNAHYMANNIPTAIAALTRAIEIDPQAEYYFHRARAYARDSRYLDAAADLTTTMKLAGETESLLRRRAAARYYGHDLDGSMADYLAVLKKNPRDGESLSGIGEIYRVRGEFERAITNYDEAIKLGDTDSLRARGLTHIILKRYDAALADLQKAMAANPEDPYTPLWIYLAQRKSGAPDSGILTKLDPKIDMAKWPAAIIRFFRSEIDAAAMQAAARVGTSRDIDGQVCESVFYLGQARLLAGAADEGRTLLRRAAETCPQGFYELDMAKAELAGAR